MAYSNYTAQTWTDGSGGGTPISAARLGVMETGLVNAHFQPAVRVFHNANQSINSATATVLAFNSERFDQAGGSADTMHDTVTNNSRLTCRYAGIYEITTNVEFAANATGVRQVDIRLNGATAIGSVALSTASAGGTRINVTTKYSLAVNDYVETVVSHTAGVAINVTVAGNLSPEFMMVRVA